MAALKTNQALFPELLALIPGLPKRVTRLVLTMAVDQIPQVEVTFQPEIDVTTLSSVAREWALGKAETQTFDLIPSAIAGRRPNGPIIPEHPEPDKRR